MKNTNKKLNSTKLETNAFTTLVADAKAQVDVPQELTQAMAQSVAQSVTLRGLENTPIEDMAAIHLAMQQFACWYNVETKLNLQGNFLVQVGEYRMTTENYSKVFKGTWKDKQLIAPFKNAKGEGVVAIVMNPKHFNRKAVMILHDLAERMVELKLSELNVSYRSQGDRFNENWRDGILPYGLIAQGNDAAHGYKYTDFTPELLKQLVTKFLPTIDENVFLLMASISVPSKGQQPQSMVGFECPKCEAKARALITTKLTCTTNHANEPREMFLQPTGEALKEAKQNARDASKAQRVARQASELA